MELTDLEICKKIAEIEGFDAIPYEHLQMSDKSKFIDLGDWTYLRNPLTNKALCFDLMVKHDITRNKSISFTDNLGFRYGHKSYGNKFFSCHKGDAHAICLAIIEKEQTK